MCKPEEQKFEDPEIEEVMPEAYVDGLIRRACDPNDDTVTLTVRGEVLMMPGVYLHLEKDYQRAPEGQLLPYQGVNFITFPKEDAKKLVKAIDAAANRLGEDIQTLLGDEGGLSFERLVDRAGFLTSSTSFYMCNNAAKHELDKINVIG